MAARNQRETTSSSPPPPDIAILSLNGAAVGGVTRVAIRLAQSLAELGWNPEVLFPPEVDEKGVEIWTERTSVSWRRLAGLRPEKAKHTVVDSLRMFAILRRHPAKIVNLHYGGASISLKDMVAARLAAKKVVVTLHAPSDWDDIGQQRRRVTSIAQRLVHRVVVVSKPVAEQAALAGIPDSKISVIPGGVPIPSPALDRGQARLELGVPEDAVVVCSVARCAPEKRLDDLIRAAAQVGCDRLWLLIKGDDSSERDNVLTLGRRLLADRFRLYSDQRFDNETLFVAGDIFCLPSDFEGYPLALQEAASYGLPAVSTRVGGIPDLIDEGHTGLLVEPRSVDQLTVALRSLVGDPARRREMGLKARREAAARFSQDAMGQAYDKLLTALVGRASER